MVGKNYPEKFINLDDKDYEKLAQIVKTFALENSEGKLVGLGAGGYSPDVTARNWLNTVKIWLT